MDLRTNATRLGTFSEAVRRWSSPDFPQLGVLPSLPVHFTDRLDREGCPESRSDTASGCVCEGMSGRDEPLCQWTEWRRSPSPAQRGITHSAARHSRTTGRRKGRWLPALDLRHPSSAAFEHRPAWFSAYRPARFSAFQTQTRTYPVSPQILRALDAD